MTKKTFVASFTIDVAKAMAAGSDAPTNETLADYLSLVCRGFGGFEDIIVWDDPDDFVLDHLEMRDVRS